MGEAYGHGEPTSPVFELTGGRLNGTAVVNVGNFRYSDPQLIRAVIIDVLKKCGVDLQDVAVMTEYDPQTKTETAKWRVE